VDDDAALTKIKRLLHEGRRSEAQSTFDWLADNIAYNVRREGFLNSAVAEHCRDVRLINLLESVRILYWRQLLTTPFSFLAGAGSQTNKVGPKRMGAVVEICRREIGYPLANKQLSRGALLELSRRGLWVVEDVEHLRGVPYSLLSHADALIIQELQVVHV
jgi:hypothetical protein